jgi:hypothetical protein
MRWMQPKRYRCTAKTQRLAVASLTALARYCALGNGLPTQADWHASAWSQLCCQHADSVLLVANAADLPSVSEVSYCAIH